MNTKEQQLLEQQAGEQTVHLKLRTGTTADVGQWWRRRPLWLCITDSHLIVLAAGRRHYCERIALADCRDSHYNPTSGELVIAPETPLRFPRLMMPASTAIEVIPLIQSPTSTPTTHQAHD